MRVAVLPTGRMELLGLPRALEALFPDHEFRSICQFPKRPGEEVPFDSFTSLDQPLTRMQRNPNLAAIVERMAAEMGRGPRGQQPPDLLFVLDDLELPNRHQPEVVVQVFREATERHLRQLASTDPTRASEVAQALQLRASFHLATPMIEAWVFADPDGPRNAGVPDEQFPLDWESTRDPEAFLTQDLAYLADDACAAWNALPSHKRKKETKPPWCKALREMHPKAYLAWLCRDPAEKNCSRYRESHEGANALAKLCWESALRSPEHCTYLRALVEDLADGLGETLELPGGSVSPHTDHRARRPSPVLRNI
jgi:hypothetical protein